MSLDKREYNAFSKPPVLTQIIAYVLVSAQFIIFSFCMLPNIADIATKAGTASIYYFTFSLGVIFWLITSRTSTHDPLAKESTKFFDNSTASSSLLYCDQCKSAVQPLSIHCMKCQVQDIRQHRCVQEFDHHCIWINHCIGKRNYTFFILMAVFIHLNFILFLIALLLLWLQARFQNFKAQMIAAWCMSLVVLVFTVLLTILLGFHIFLKVRGTTTFLYLSKNKVKMALNELIAQQSQPKVQGNLTKTQQRGKQAHQIGKESAGIKDQDLFFQLQRKYELTQSIHDLKIQRSKTKLAKLSKQKGSSSRQNL